MSTSEELPGFDFDRLISGMNQEIIAWQVGFELCPALNFGNSLLSVCCFPLVHFYRIEYPILKLKIFVLKEELALFLISINPFLKSSFVKMRFL